MVHAVMASLSPRSFVLRFAGDSGDGMILAGLRFAAAAAQAGHDVQTLPICPSEIRAPAGSPHAVSAMQVHFGNRPIFTPGDTVDALFVMNPAALRLHLPDLAPGGLLIANSDAFEPAELEKAGYTTNPLDSLAGVRLVATPIHRLNREAVAPVKLLSPREADRSRNFFALGLACWAFTQSLEPAQRWVREKFSKNPVAVDANLRTLQAGFDHGRSLPLTPVTLAGPPRPPGKYRRIAGHEALCLGLVAAARQMKRPLVFAAFPRLPASELQQHFFDFAAAGVQAVEAEDEHAAAGIAIGAAFAGGLGVTVTTGSGLGLMSETIGLAVASELPLVVVDVMRAGAGNGLPTASDQADLLLAVFGRGGDSPIVVLAPQSPAQAFEVAALAARLAVKAMTPVVVLTDTHVGLASEIWKTPSIADLPGFAEGSSRPWIVPGTPGGEHRLTGLQTDPSGRLSLDPLNHEQMTARRAEKVDRLAADVPPAEVVGAGDTLIVGWGSSSGPIRAAVHAANEQGQAVAGVLLTSLHPLPANLEAILRGAKRVLVAEANRGQLALILRGRYAIDAESITKVQGRPFQVAELLKAIG